ncbi:MAG: hypothetical protein H6551_03075 [Chitinophagales bacterium]|nr:hypothetical protein [Chitinophagales bacterium]
MDGSNLFIDEASKIADKIIDSSIKCKSGIYWETKKYDETIEINTNLYSGNSGILYFLIELYKIKKSKKLLDSILNSAQWLIADNDYRDNNLAIYCGAGGVAFVLIELFKITDDNRYKNAALEIARMSKIDHRKSDILYGSSGAILTLLHLYNETNEAFLLELIIQNIDSLLESACFTKEGTSWERNCYSIRPLCGFAHGASGIAFVFGELYRFFGNDLFRRISQSAFEYENSFFEAGNWPDFRKIIIEEEDQKKFIDFYINQQTEEFSSYSFMSAWCHGAPGIGLANLHAQKISEVSNGNMSLIVSAINTTSDTFNLKVRNYTLCHGILGNAHLLIEAFTNLNHPPYYDIAREQAIKCINDEKKYGYWISGISKKGSEADCSLFNGIAGIGHFYLRLFKPFQTTSPLIPYVQKIKAEKRGIEKYDDMYLLNVMMKNLFPNTYININENEIKTTPEWKSNSLREDVINMVNGFLNDKNSYRLAEYYKVDTFKMDLADSIWSNAYLYAKHLYELKKVQQKNYSELTLNNMMQYHLKLNNTVLLYKYNIGTAKSHLVLQATYDGEPVNQYYVSEQTFKLLHFFKECNTVEKAYNYLRKDSENTTKYTFDSIFKSLLDHCINNFFLVEDRTTT